MIIVEQFFKVTYFHCGIQIVSQAQTTNRFSVLYGAFRLLRILTAKRGTTRKRMKLGIVLLNLNNLCNIILLLLYWIRLNIELHVRLCKHYCSGAVSSLSERRRKEKKIFRVEALCYCRDTLASKIDN